MNDENQTDATQQPRVRPVSPPVEVPVYNCLVLVAPPDEQGVVRARAANLAGLEVAGRSEREALQQLVAAFKNRLTETRDRGETIVWTDPPLDVAPGERQRWIAVHL